MAVLPGVALDELWDVVGVGERALLAMSALVAAGQPGRAGGRDAGRTERAPARAGDAARGGRRPRHVLVLLALEGARVTLLGVLLGRGGAGGGHVALAPWLQPATASR